MAKPETTDLDEFDLSIKPDIDIASKFFRGLADPTRLRIVDLLLTEGEMNVSDLVNTIGGMQGRVSSHLACLRHCGLVADRKDGRNVYYSVPDQRVAQFLPVALSMIADNAEHIASCHRIES